MIAGERIEYMERNNNVLSRIRRGTLGTGGKDYPVGTSVIDQGISHTIPYSEAMLKYSTATTVESTVTSYIISGLMLNSSITLTDQVEVYYGGRLLRKPTPDGSIQTVHDPAISFDSGEIAGDDTIVPPEFNIVMSNSTATTATLVVSLSTPAMLGKQITVLQRISPKGIDWYLDDGSLLDDSSEVAKFLRERPAPLPDKYHYGQF